MNSALLKHPIEILQLNTVSSASGHNKATYEHKYNTKAHITFNSENQVVSEGEVFYPTTRTFIVRAYVPVVVSSAPLLINSSIIAFKSFLPFDLRYSL